ncbi:MAG: 4Fe-4S cluster-binding domain-containing protein [Ruminococcaceae bacterium]|nr:4Fe-4S cluster-binding domain-containing protein [Oscillospiraceae bacterium]
MLVHSFESLAARDGDGLRYAVFLAGCPLRCIYCHNPDTWTMQTGKEYTNEQILKKILRCKPYMKAGNGGVTFSGGEPLLQADELADLILQLRENEIGSCIDTAGNVALSDAVKKVFLVCESVLLDLKFATQEEYYAHTAGSLQRTLDTLTFLTENNIPTRIRTVIVPGYNDTEESICRYAAILRPFKNKITDWELLGFHTLGFIKYDALQIENPLKEKSALPREQLTALQTFAKSIL